MGWPASYDIRPAENAHFRRWRFLRIFGWAVALHSIRIGGGYAGWDDHAWDSWSLCLWGRGLDTTRERGGVVVRPGTVMFRPAERKHNFRGNLLTLILTGPKKRRRYLYLQGPDGAAVELPR